MTILKFKNRSIALNYNAKKYINDINNLESLIAESKSELKLISLELKKLENEISNFLDNYYKSIGKYFKNSEYMGVSNNNKKNDKKYKAVIDSLNSSIKKLYKRLAKMCHPDIAKDDKSKYIIELNEAYNNNNLQELIKIEEYLAGDDTIENESPQNKLSRLSKEYDLILEKINDCKNKKQDLLNSPAYELKEQVMWAKMRGEDLISEIKKHLSNQLVNNEM